MNKGAVYQERVYRKISRPSDLHCYEVRQKETDLLCCTTVELGPLIEERITFYRHQLEEYIRLRPSFAESLVPVPFDEFAPFIAKEMMTASAVVGVGPMATVAGAVAEFVGRDIRELSEEFILENGGDICLRITRERKSLIYAGDSPFSGRIALRLKPRDRAFGVCTSSGTVGHSLSFGRADAVCVIGESALFCDGVATCLGNGVKKKSDIPSAIDRGKSFPGVTGILIIVGEQMGAWGNIEIEKP
jgi:uncharacterized protein